MAYISADDVALIRAALKKEFPEFKFAVRKSSGSHAVCVSIMRGNVDFFNTGVRQSYDDVAYADINTYHLYNYGDHEALFARIVDVIKTAPNKKYFNNSDIQTDYFHVAFYYDLQIGKWNQSYELVA